MDALQVLKNTEYMLILGKNDLFSLYRSASSGFLNKQMAQNDKKNRNASR